MGEKMIPFEEKTETRQKAYKSLWNVSPNFFSFLVTIVLLSTIG